MEFSQIVELITSLVTNVGFPIAACVAMYTEMRKEREAHQSESARWIEALNNNTQVLVLIKEKLQ